ncbi:hypothetical protein CHH28_12965 [Bacterioplanes sanyensis]|uniref:DUF2268 domain-containing protein n=1 Tax=Bacterioplanes sanyensis TaxID=1249553 RepID=A0A222FL87_9GAMM|nr:DUF2268 domain-containing putative Zn-dependent protease [Bacterioplanes sanyensis]ASP39529.1 hypothetical protein CHH28_12965 [Bacterioplanes sanyensis]
MEYQIHCLDAAKKLAPYADDLMQRSQRIMDQLVEVLPLSPMDFSLCPASHAETIPHGIGGYALSEHRVEIFFDTQRDDLLDCIERDYASVLVHEMHHAARIGVSAPQPDTLASAVVREGLACHFEQTMTGVVPSLFNALWDQDWRVLYQRMQPELHAPSYDMGLYLLGSQPDVFPRYAAYWVGYNIVQEYLQTGQLSELELVGVDSKVLIDFANGLL